MLGCSRYFRGAFPQLRLGIGDSLCRKKTGCVGVFLHAVGVYGGSGGVEEISDQRYENQDGELIRSDEREWSGLFSRKDRSQRDVYLEGPEHVL